MNRFPSTALRGSREVRLLGVDVRIASNDEPEWDRGAVPAGEDITEEEWLAADVARNVDKAQRWHQRNDAHAMDLQIQMQGCIGGLPE